MTVNATATSVKSQGSTVQMTFTAPAPDGTGNNAFVAQTSAFGADGVPLDAPTILAALIVDAKAQYRVKFPPPPVVPAAPAPFAVN